MGESEVLPKLQDELQAAIRLRSARAHNGAWAITLYERNGQEVASVIVQRGFWLYDVVNFGNVSFVWCSMRERYVRAKSIYIGLDALAR